MKKIWLVSIIVGVILVIGVFAGVYISYNNDEIRLRNEAEAQLKDIEMTHDNMWKIISQKAQVSNEYANKFDEIYTHIMDERYDKNDGVVMNWIKEANPNFDTSLYEDLSQSIEVYRNEFLNSQKRMNSIVQEHKNLCTTWPGNMVIKNTTPITFKVISSTKTKNVMSTGVDDDTELFNQK